MILRTSVIAVSLLGSLVSAYAQSELSDDSKPGTAVIGIDRNQLGSTMTLEEIQTRKGKKQKEETPVPLTVRPAPEPSPALRYRFYPPKWELDKSSALLHYTRAQLAFHEFSREQQIQLQTWAGTKNPPSDDELANAVEQLHVVFEELKALALSEDFSWDHRIRDLRGPGVYMYRLMDVQEVRAMARLLILKIQLQIRQRDFEGAIASIRDGIRLAEFVGQGETLIQKLVGIACQSMMRDQIRQLISTPGCPNLYWALASIPRPLTSISESVLWELGSIHRVLPVLKEAEEEIWSEAETAKKWKTAVDDLNVLSNSNLYGPEAQVILAIASVVHVDEVRNRLAAGGMTKEQLDERPALQLVLIDASRELKRVGDQLGKAHLLPSGVGGPLLRRGEDEFKEWRTREKNQSVAAAIASLLFPAVRQAKEAGIRTQMSFNRLMTLEALRMYAAEHDGRLPDSLSDLSPVPALPDSYTGDAFQYSTRSVGGTVEVTLEAAGPTNYPPLKTLKATFAAGQ